MTKKIVTVGKLEIPEELPDVEVCTIPEFNRKIAYEKTLAEKIFLLRTLSRQVDGILVNLSSKKEKITIDELLFLQLAYTMNTPICGIGEHNGNPYLDSVVLRRFDNVLDAIDYITVIRG